MPTQWALAVEIDSLPQSSSHKTGSLMAGWKETPNPSVNGGDFSHLHYLILVPSTQAWSRCHYCAGEKHDDLVSVLWEFLIQMEIFSLLSSCHLAFLALLSLILLLTYCLDYKCAGSSTSIILFSFWYLYLYFDCFVFLNVSMYVRKPFICRELSRPL